MFKTQEKAYILDRIRDIVKEIRDLEKQVVDLWYYIAENDEFPSNDAQ